MFLSAVILYYTYVPASLTSASFSSKVGCEHEKINLECEPFARLAIFSASYGRTQYQSVQCPQPQGVAEESAYPSQEDTTSRGVPIGEPNLIMLNRHFPSSHPCMTGDSDCAGEFSVDFADNCGSDVDYECPEKFPSLFMLCGYCHKIGVGE